MTGGVELPLARVMVDSPLPHLDRPFDYRVPAELSEQVQRGVRVRVRFAGRLLDAWVLERLAQSEHTGRLSALERVVGAEPILTEETVRLFRAVADRWAGTFADVVRLGVPSRHAQAEAAATLPDAGPVPPLDEAAIAQWSDYPSAASYLTALAEGRAARAVLNVKPGEDWPQRLAEAVQASLHAGRGAVVVVPDARDAARVDAALTRQLPTGAHAWLSADLGPQARYRRWLAVRRGAVRAVVGPRSAVYAPVRNLGLIAVWDDGDDLLAEPRAPYPHARDVAVLRASLARSALLVAGVARTAEASLLVESGWAHDLLPDRRALRSAAPRIVATGDDLEAERDPAARSARLPALALRSARQALERDTAVLVQVPRRGYVPALACTRDRTPARCTHCHGPLAAATARGVPHCRWCGRPAVNWTCPTCGSTTLRAVVVGSARTAEELGRAFPSVPIRSSAGDSVLAEVPAGRAIVVATPGAEPVVEGGYGAALLLDGWALLARPDLRAAEEALRRWLNAAMLVAADGAVVVGADAQLAAVQALVRWDPAGHAARELAERRELGFAPASRMASLTGAVADVADLLASARLPDSAEEIGSVSVPPPAREGRAAAGRPAGSVPGEPSLLTRTLLRVPRVDGAALAESLHAAAAVRSARKTGQAVRIQLDPVELF